MNRHMLNINFKESKLCLTTSASLMNSSTSSLVSIAPSMHATLIEPQSSS